MTITLTTRDTMLAKRTNSLEGLIFRNFIFFLSYVLLICLPNGVCLRGTLLKGMPLRGYGWGGKGLETGNCHSSEIAQKTHKVPAVGYVLSRVKLNKECKGRTDR